MHLAQIAGRGVCVTARVRSCLLASEMAHINSRAIVFTPVLCNASAVPEAHDQGFA